MCATFPGGGRPSQVARPLIEPELRSRGVRLSPLDWYAFDVAAAARWQDLQRESADGTPEVDTGGASDIPQPTTERRNGPLYEGPGGGFRLVGDEIPPWQKG
jgi:hypothetical protein